ncbi:germin-like protein 2-4 isoform X2 [Panicum virgatum]|uniref:germin-like protein 2-4 isoform X2 n=1 Tax=Panicum virgatum TaxID=38727 RepID=UPI0019D5DC10|nr:germin-like protein 2-4 isoform X2 [Panicum virgatum]
MAAHHLLLLLAALLPAAATADPDAVQDYCVPDAGGRGRPLELALLPSYPCRSPGNLTAADFAFAGVRAAGNFSADTGFAGVSVTPAQFPALHTLGVSFARADLSAAGGVNPPHYHPRATETALVLAGRVYAGFVDSGGRIFAKVLEKGEVMVFPRAMVHFQMNVGIVRIPATVFGSGISAGVLERAFGLSPAELRRLEKRFGPPKTKLSEMDD